ncbi:peptidoglycan-binding protein [Maritalea porphyrae]|uniref:peptidoglycan-binding protein n=1 Tax=Maritalea porphyrae TaxID=880732 RepID=UPI0022AF6194|nr:peptidoglycan-binding protein [Maritalea porphyrae]MCZ4271587.1 peptidoglycan-binding protein [Maritalea porphyrae]
MPKSRSHLAQAPSASRYGSAPQPWDALKSELEDLLGQVQDQISEFEGDDVHEPQLHSQVGRPMSGASDLEMRRQEALMNVRTAVDRLGAKQERPKKKSKKKKKKHAGNDLEAAIAQIRASTGRLDNDTPPRSVKEHHDNANSSYQTQQQDFGRAQEYAQAQSAAQNQSFERLTGQIEGLHRSIRDLAGAVPGRDSFARVESQIAQLSAEIDDHKSPQANAISDQLDGLQYALERLAELQVRQIGHIEQIKTHEENDHGAERQQRIEESIRSIYEKFDTLEQSIERPNSSIETIAKGIGSIARAVGDMQKRSQNDQSHNILAQIENLSQRLSAMDNGQPNALTQDVKREMQGLRGQLVSALEPRFTALETRLDDFATSGQVPGAAADYQNVTARIEEMEDRITHAIEGISNAQVGEAGQSGSPQTVALLKAMETRLSDALVEIRDAGSQANNGSTVSLDSLHAMEKRIGEAISRLPSIAKTPNDDQYDGLRAIENKLTHSLQRLEALSSAPRPAQTPSAAPAPVSTASASAAPQEPSVQQPQRKTESGITIKSPPVRSNVATPLAALKQSEPTVSSAVTAPKTQDAETPPTPKSSFGFNEKPAEQRPQRSAPMTSTTSSPAPSPAVSTTEQRESSSTTKQSRESFIAAARRATVERTEPSAAVSGNGGLLGRALDRIKSIKQGNAENEGADQQPEQQVAQEPSPIVEAETKLERSQTREDVRTLSVGPEPARPQSLADTPKPKSALDEAELASKSDDADQEDTHEGESFLTRNRQPILLAASVVAIIAMTANLVLDKGQTTDSSTIPSSVQEADVSEAPRQISLTEVETALSNAQAMPAETVSLTSSMAITDQSVGLVAPTPQLVDNEIVTASIPNSPVEVELPPTELGPTALREAAANGDPRAQYEVGMIFAEGKAVPKDSQEAVKWFERSAATGFAAAQYRLGTAFEHGLGVNKDLDQAKLWYLRSAEAGNRMGMHNLAALHASGPDGERDFSIAARWFEEAAMRGVLDSQFNLGMLYARGLGVSQDFTTSFKWFSIAAANGDKDAQKARDDVARSLDAAQMSEIKRELAEWRPKQIDLISNFAPIGTWDKNFNPGVEINQREVVLGVQIALSKLGFQLGTPDGVMGPKTRDAISQFERTLGMSQSGTINPRLLTVLNGQPV